MIIEIQNKPEVVGIGNSYRQSKIGHEFIRTDDKWFLSI